MSSDPLSSQAHLTRARAFGLLHLSREIQYGLDLVVLTLAFALAYLVRFEFAPPSEYVSNALVQAPAVVLWQFALLHLTGAYQFVWRYVGMRELGTFLRAASYAAAPLLLLRLSFPVTYQQWRIPLSVILMDTVFAFGGLLAIRVLRRAVYERYERRRVATGTARHQRALLVGAGEAGVAAARAMQGSNGSTSEPVGFVDDDPRKHGSVIQGVKVVGATSELPKLLYELEIERVVITMTTAAPGKVRSIFEACERAGVSVQIVPSLPEILGGKVSVSRFRDVQIEDLLGREPVRLDEDKVRQFLTGKSILLTGAGGSIGSELARQIARFNPLRLVLLERSEAALFSIEQELKTLWPQLDLVPFLADVQDESRMRRAFDRSRPQVVFHAAAHKHVPMMELHPSEAIQNNIFGTEALGRLAGEAGAEAFVFVSTDKAVKPSSVMGASKRVAELVTQDCDRRYPDGRFLAVRFGNVLGSAGSVVPIFREQISRGGPVTVTHPEATRYFMTTSEAAQLVLEAGAIGNGGEILILEMGEPVRVLDLAKDMISLSGYQPFEEIAIVFTGLRPGEKLVEELELSGENIDRTIHPKVYVGRLAAYQPDRIEDALAKLNELAIAEDAAGLRRFLAEFLPEAELETVLASRTLANADEQLSVH